MSGVTTAQSQKCSASLNTEGHSAMDAEGRADSIDNIFAVLKTRGQGSGQTILQNANAWWISAFNEPAQADYPNAPIGSLCFCTVGDSSTSPDASYASLFLKTGAAAWSRISETGGYVLRYAGTQAAAANTTQTIVASGKLITGDLVDVILYQGATTVALTTIAQGLTSLITATVGSALLTSNQVGYRVWRLRNSTSV